MKKNLIAPPLQVFANPITTSEKGFYSFVSSVDVGGVQKMRRRSQRHRLHWSYLTNQSWCELPYAVAMLPCDGLTAIQRVQPGVPVAGNSLGRF